MFNLGAGEIIVILVLALVFLGPKQLPEMATKLGKVIRDIRKATSDIKNEITLDDSFRKPFEELRDAVTLHPDELRRREEIQRSVEEAKKRAAAEVARVEAEMASAAAAHATPPPEALPAVEPGEPAPASDSPFVPPVAPPAGTVARTTQGAPPAVVAEESAPLAASSGAEPPPTPPARPRGATPSSGILTSAVTPLGHPPRVTPPVSSLSGDRANTTQTLSEADLLASVPPAPQKATRPPPPPLPGLDRNPPPANRMGLPRVTPPVSSLSGDRANATQSLSEKDLLPPGAGKPPPLPGSKKA
ncbi:MAG TPA: twin-arginine translocase TatA/TatE family subunit [Polyangia bacterium]